MKITLNWLKQYVAITGSADELAARLTMLGLEVEAIHKIGGEFDGIVVAHVLSCDKHPNADKLSLCRVNDGHGERQIVCGAHNFKVGDKVPLILPGRTLPAKPGQPPVTIKAGRIRGIESHGMLCSPDELGLPDKVDGLLILRQDAIPGQPFSEYLGRPAGDVVLDLEITPNRPDWNSLIGIAREISALTGLPLCQPPIVIPSAQTSSESINNLIHVRLLDPLLCPRYVARLVRGVKIGPSPDWLRSVLEKVGLRSINNVVDVTNFVMLESGQPLHAFDYRLLAPAKPGSAPSIIVRCAADSEKFTTLDGRERSLNAEMLLIADETKPVALAGIMGGRNSEISADTTDVLIESACFNPRNIRATSKKLDLRTDSSYRFERGSDIGICDWASRRAAQLILETAGGSLLEQALDIFPHPPQPREIALRPEKTNQLLGINIPVEDQARWLVQLGLERRGAPAHLTFAIPTFRVDLKREVDLIEEIARLQGVDRIPPTPPRGAHGANAYDSVHDTLADARRLLTALGFNEAQGQTLISSDASDLVVTTAAPAVVTLRHPLSSDMNALRPSLLPGLLDSLRHNVSRKNSDVALFEIGRVFFSANDHPSEERRLALALTGRRGSSFWSGAERDARADIFDLKGALEEFLDQFGLRGLSWSRRDAPGPFFIESGAIQLGRYPIGEFGQLSPALARRYDLREPAFLAELNLDTLIARRQPAKSFKPLPSFPAIRRDVAMLVPDSTTHDAILQTVKQAKPQNLEKVEIFDIFRGENIPHGSKSVAYAFTYRNPDRTLTDNEVNAAHNALVEQFKQRHQATIRDAAD